MICSGLLYKETYFVKYALNAFANCNLSFSSCKLLSCFLLAFKACKATLKVPATTCVIMEISLQNVPQDQQFAFH